MWYLLSTFKKHNLCTAGVHKAAVCVAARTVKIKKCNIIFIDWVDRLTPQVTGDKYIQKFNVNDCFLVHTVDYQSLG